MIRDGIRERWNGILTPPADTRVSSSTSNVHIPFEEITIPQEMFSYIRIH